MYLAINTFEAGSTLIAILWLLSVGKEACASINDLVIDGPLTSHILAVNRKRFRRDPHERYFYELSNTDFEFLGWHPAFRALRVTACRLKDPNWVLRWPPTKAQQTYHQKIMHRARKCSQEGWKGFLLACLASTYRPLQLLADSEKKQAWQLVLHSEEHFGRVWKEAKSSAWRGFVSFPGATRRFPMWLRGAIRDRDVEVIGFLVLTLCATLSHSPASTAITTRG